MSWHYPPELPEEGEAVIIETLGACDEPLMIAADWEDGYWSEVVGRPVCDFKTGKWWGAVDCGEWKRPVIRWHRYPDPREGEKEQ